MPHILGRGRVFLPPAPEIPGPAASNLRSQYYQGPGLKGRHYWHNAPCCQLERRFSADFPALCAPKPGPSLQPRQGVAALLEQPEHALFAREVQRADGDESRMPLEIRQHALDHTVVAFIQ